MVRSLCLFLICFILPAAQANPQVQQPARSHGYFIGDVLLQRLNLNTSMIKTIDPELETGERISAYLYRLPAAEVTIKKQRWLEIRYQIINSPPLTRTINLPAMTFKTESGDDFQLDAWPFTVAPLTSFNASDNGSNDAPLPDRTALDVIETRNSRSLKLSLIALLATLTLWLLWWLFRHFSDSRSLAFSKASHTIKKLPRAQRNSEPDAWIALHHAFNNVAGKTISTRSLADLFAAAPWLHEYKGSIENFYAASAARFFQQADAPPSVAVADLCDTLLRAEKRQPKKTTLDPAG